MQATKKTQEATKVTTFSNIDRSLKVMVFKLSGLTLFVNQLSLCQAKAFATTKWSATYYRVYHGCNYTLGLRTVSQPLFPEPSLIIRFRIEAFLFRQELSRVPLRLRLKTKRSVAELVIHEEA